MRTDTTDATSLLTYLTTLYADLKEQLRPVEMSAASRPRCLPETRTQEIRFITEWVNEATGGKKVLWLPGQAGFGKSTLSTTLAYSFATYRRLGAFIFFDRDVAERSDPSRVVETLACQLASFDSGVSEKITLAVQENSSVLGFGLRVQFKELILRPLCSIPTLPLIGPIVVVLDALDECGNEESRAALLAVLAEDAAKLPTCVRIIVTGRPSFDIVSAFENRAHITRRDLEITPENSKDIDVFLRHSMKEVIKSKRHLALGSGWPGDDSIESLSAHAGGLFIWADTASRYISRSHNPSSNLEALASGKPPKDTRESLAHLYETALLSNGRWSDDDFCLAFRQVIGAILVAKAPLSSTAIDQIFSLESTPSRGITSRFDAVLTEVDGKIRVFHPSFYEFLTDKDSAGTDSKWFIDVDLHNRNLAFACIDLLERNLKENICGLTRCWGPISPPVPLSEEISYACMFWIRHAVDVSDDAPALAARIDTLMHAHLVHWLEAMSILKQFREVGRLLEQLIEWIAVSLSVLSRLPRMLLNGLCTGKST